MREVRRFGVLAGLFMGLIAFVSVSAKAQKKVETIHATAWGQQRASGRLYNLTININSYSTPEDQQTLLSAFQKGGQRELVRALERMKSKGQVAFTGTVGTSIAYIRSFPMENGRRIRILTQRPIYFAEAFHGGRSTGYDVTLLELNLNQKNPDNSNGSVIFGARIKFTKSGQIEVESYGSGPWRLSNIKEWK